MICDDCLEVVAVTGTVQSAKMFKEFQNNHDCSFSRKVNANNTDRSDFNLIIIILGLVPILH
jgi:hypothetical protein